MIRAAAAALLLCGPAGAGAAAAQDFIVTSGMLADADFYHLVACRAVPGRPCAEPLVRWPESAARDVTVALQPIPSTYPKPLAKLMVAALDRAIAALNDAGARLHLRRTEGSAHIRLFLTPARDGERIVGTGVSGIDGEVIGAGLTTIWWNGSNALTRGVIVMAGDLPDSEVYPVMLEELTQAMGLLTDIRNPYYNDISVFSEDSNRVTALGPQDVMALRRHYP